MMVCVDGYWTRMPGTGPDLQWNKIRIYCEQTFKIFAACKEPLPSCSIYIVSVMLQSCIRFQFIKHLLILICWCVEKLMFVKIFHKSELNQSLFN